MRQSRPAEVEWHPKKNASCCRMAVCKVSICFTSAFDVPLPGKCGEMYGSGVQPSLTGVEALTELRMPACDKEAQLCAEFELQSS
jgi:hypothetical protein